LIEGAEEYDRKVEMANAMIEGTDASSENIVYHKN
jgi:hypothetical protein